MNWQDGEFHDRDDEALESEGPCNVRVKQPDGTWMKLAPSEWEDEPPAAAPTMLEALRLAQSGVKHRSPLPRRRY